MILVLTGRGMWQHPGVICSRCRCGIWLEDFFFLLGRKFSCCNQHFFFSIKVPLNWWEHTLLLWLHCALRILSCKPRVWGFPITPLCLFWKFVTCYWVHVPIDWNTNTVIDCITERNTTFKCQHDIHILCNIFIPLKWAVKKSTW